MLHNILMSIIQMMGRLAYRMRHDSISFSMFCDMIIAWLK